LPFLQAGFRTRVDAVLHADDSQVVRRLTELRATLPSDHTLQNLLSVVTAKLELCSKLPIYEYEAATEGHGYCVSAFRQLAEAERRAFEDVLCTLRQHLDATMATSGTGVEGAVP
jgi:hypothetical protein